MNALAIALALFSFQDPAAGFDFGKVDRKIKSEPKYEMSPRYALLMVGDPGMIRMWMSMDISVGDDIVYIDLDGDGNLGEKGERFVAKKDKWGSVAASIGKIEFAERKIVLEDVVVSTRQVGETQPALRVSFRMNGKVTVHGGQAGLEWAESPLKAPILHADPFGVLSFMRTSPGEWKIDQEENVTLAVGTPGSTPGAFFVVDEHFLDPEKDKIVLTLTGRDAKGDEVKARFHLKDHC